MVSDELGAALDRTINVVTEEYERTLAKTGRLHDALAEFERLRSKEVGIGAFIRDHRKRLQLTQVDLGRLTGISHTTISKLEAGKVLGGPGADTVLEWLAARF